MDEEAYSLEFVQILSEPRRWPMSEGDALQAHEMKNREKERQGVSASEPQVGDIGKEAASLVHAIHQHPDPDAAWQTPCLA